MLARLITSLFYGCRSWYGGVQLAILLQLAIYHAPSLKGMEMHAWSTLCIGSYFHTWVNVTVKQARKINSEKEMWFCDYKEHDKYFGNLFDSVYVFCCFSFVAFVVSYPHMKYRLILDGCKRKLRISSILDSLLSSCRLYFNLLLMCLALLSMAILQYCQLLNKFYPPSGDDTRKPSSSQILSYACPELALSLIL